MVKISVTSPIAKQPAGKTGISFVQSLEHLNKKNKSCKQTSSLYRAIVLSFRPSCLARYNPEGNMTSFPLTAGAHYVRSLNMFNAKSGQRMKIFKILGRHIPPLIQTGSLSCCQQRSSFNILSIGSGTGEMDMEIMNIIENELQKSDQGRPMKIFNRAIEPNEYSCSLYKAAIENLPSPLNSECTEFEICQQTFQEYKESQQRQEDVVKFDMVHFIHSIYYVDIEQTYTCQLFLRYRREIFILGVLGFLKMTRSFPNIPEEVRSLPKKSEVFRRHPKMSHVRKLGS